MQVIISQMWFSSHFSPLSLPQLRRRGQFCNPLIKSPVFKTGQLEPAGHFCYPTCPSCSVSPFPSNQPPPVSPLVWVTRHLAATRLMGDTVSPRCPDGRLLPNVILIAARAALNHTPRRHAESTRVRWCGRWLTGLFVRRRAEIPANYSQLCRLEVSTQV